MVEMARCPIETSFYNTSLHKKWTLTLIRDMILGEKKFSNFLKKNPDLGSKILSQRLKEMESEGLINKTVIEDSPPIVDYTLTDKGLDLNKVLFELSMYGSKYYAQEVFPGEAVKAQDFIDIFGAGFQLSDGDIIYQRTPTVVKTREIPTHLVNI